MIIIFAAVLLLGDRLVFKVETEFKNVDLAKPGYIDFTSERIYVLDTSLRQVHYWELATGEHGGHFAEKGEGPGEISLKTGIGEIMCFDKKIMIFDESAAKVHYFDKDHNYLKTSPLPGMGRYSFWRTSEYLIARRVSTSRGIQEILVMDGHLNTIKAIAQMPYKVHEWIDDKTYYFRPFANLYVAAGSGSYFFLGETHDNYVRVFRGTEEVDQFRTPVMAVEISIEQIENFKKRYNPNANIKLEIDPRDPPFFNSLLSTDPYIIMASILSRSGTVKGRAFDRNGKEVGAVDQRFGELAFIGGFEGRLMVMSFTEEGDYQLKVYKPEIKPNTVNRQRP